MVENFSVESPHRVIVKSRMKLLKNGTKGCLRS